jgi:hypothetical protein
MDTGIHDFDYSVLREGEVEPVLGKRIDTLIAKHRDYIVYLDDELYVEWASSDRGLNDDWGAVMYCLATQVSAD